MGRWYSGDIEGKFWFAVQSSSAADRFGSEGTCGYLDYFFDEDDLPKIESEIKAIQDSLDMEKMEKFYGENAEFTSEMLADANINKHDVQQYADLQLGIKIRDCVIETGECTFTAEL
tara:strand:- start:1172 stop:1522 length:351 start_codon:yes stop_codon:yes gene_type:complete